MNEEQERLVRVKMDDGSFIDFKRTADKNVHICHAGQCAVLGKASAQVTFELLSIFSELGEIVEEGD